MDLMDFDRFGESLIKTLGVKLRDPVPVSLGYTDEDGVQILKVSADSNKYYYSGAPGTELTPGEAINSGAHPLDERFLYFGAKVYIRQDELDPNIYYLAGVQPTPTNNAVLAQALKPPKANYLHEFVPGLLDQTDPASMRCRVMGAPYTMAGTFKKIETQLTIDFTSDLPATVGRAKYVRVAIDFYTGALDYAYGNEVDAILTDTQAFQQDGGTGLILPHTQQEMFRVGFVKLVFGMTQIKRLTHIFAAQEVLTRTDYKDILTAADEVVTCDGDVLYV